MKNLVLLHRWLGVVACVAVLMFAGSGILHPVMSRLQPQPAQFIPPRVELPASVLPLRAVLDKNQIDEFSAATLLQLPDNAAYRVQTGAGVRYLRADNGDEIGDGERKHAEYLARHFLHGQLQETLHGANQDKDSIGQPLAMTQAARIDNFDDDYVFVNRLLPVWRVEFARDDGIRVYVDTAGNRLATLTDRPKRIFQTYFRALHNFEFLEGQPALRLTVMLVLLSSAFFTAVAGVVMYFRLRRASQRLQRLAVRRWHRRLSLAVAVVTFSFTLSGAWHLLQSQVEVATSTPPPTLFQREELGDVAIDQAFGLLRVAGKPCYRLNTAVQRGGEAEHEHHHPMPAGKPVATPVPDCIDTQSSQPVADALPTLAKQLARFYSGSTAPMTTLEQVTRFEGEYGFINKRLPVWKVQFEGDATRWYVEVASGALALRADANAAREGWFFSIFHKARFIVDPYKNLRDGFLMVVALGCIAVALLGLWMFIRQLLIQRSRRGDPIAV
ncbi:MAG: PepSY-associated TM helix domain-containing protein [Spongiibacteraceae bacterium]